MPEALVGRRKEMLILENQFRSEGSSLVAVTGRRHSGKTALLTYFASRHPNTLYFPAREEPASRNLAYFRRAAGEFLNDPSAAADADWNRTFRALVGGRRSQKVVVIIDDFDRIGRKDPSFPPLVRYIWDTVLRNSRTMLVLSGSSFAEMDRQVTDYDAPLFAAMTARIDVRPLAYEACRELLGGEKAGNALEYYAAAGGIALFLKRLALHQSVSEGISEELLVPGGSLCREPMEVLRAEVADPGVYVSVMTSIATGHRRLLDISEDLGVPQTGLTSYLANLVSAGIAEREVPVPGGGKKGRYCLSDPLSEIWFGCVNPNLALLETGRRSALTALISAKMRDDMVPRAYRRACTERLWDMSSSGAWNFALTEAGGWWDREAEIGVCGYDASGRNLVAGDCSLRGRPKGLQDLEELEAASKRAARQLRAGAVYWVMFSPDGFDRELEARAASDQRIRLVPLE